MRKGEEFSAATKPDDQDAPGDLVKPHASVCVGVAGGSASGKSTLVARLINEFGAGAAAVLAHDRYYRDQSHLTPEERAAVNYDHPAALDTGLLLTHLESLRAGCAIAAPVYDFSRHVRAAATERISPAPIIFVEGVLVLADAGLRLALDLRVFVSADEKTRYARRLTRDVVLRGRTAASVEAQYQTTVRPMHLEFVEPSRAYADLIVTQDACTNHELGRVRDRILMIQKLPIGSRGLVHADNQG
jgi:uridine kinase